MENKSRVWPCLAAHPDGVTLAIKASPNAAKTSVEGLWDNNLKVRVHAPAVEGKANEAIMRWAAEAFGLRRRQVALLKGERQPLKVLLLREVTLEHAELVIGDLLRVGPSE